MTERCHDHEALLNRIAAGEVIEVPDNLATHLDSCTHCRDLFDRGRVPLDDVEKERLDADRRQRLLRTLVAPRGRRIRWRLAAAAVLAIGAASTGLLVLRGFDAAETPAQVTVALVEDHIRYLGRPERRSDLEPAALEKDLQTYVDFPIRLPAVSDIDLTGARRCYLLGRRVALGFYAGEGAELSYFVLPAGGISLPAEDCPAAGFRCESSDGYSVVTWERAGLLHGVVGADCNATLEFARAVAD